MKKIFSTLVIMVCLLLAVPAQAQVKFGLKGGLDVSKLDNKVGDNTTGFFVGPMVDVTLPIIGLGIDVAALYSQSGLDVNNKNSEKLKSVEIPVNLKWTLGLGSTLGVYVAAGPQFGFSINDGWKQLMEESNKSFVSVNVGAGLKLLRHLQVGVNYNIGASKLGDMIVESADGNLRSSIRKNSWQVSLAYMF
ncbi:porin family protein [Bacteroides caecigallinarum]|uniref:porin family protein n=1 Tax=Bacteroides caecigallinarum TaxID=1411144 RepID=UPI001957A1A6|nr:porin family protein [Bacteroides caecigallinarum]MBM6960643.1 porin family protein [Bacteroides caecigallinarum]